MLKFFLWWESSQDSQSWKLQWHSTISFIIEWYFWCCWDELKTLTVSSVLMFSIARKQRIWSPIIPSLYWTCLSVRVCASMFLLTGSVRRKLVAACTSEDENDETWTQHACSMAVPEDRTSLTSPTLAEEGWTCFFSPLAAAKGRDSSVAARTVCGHSDEELPCQGRPPWQLEAALEGLPAGSGGSYAQHFLFVKDFWCVLWCCYVSIQRLILLCSGLFWIKKQAKNVLF